MIMTRTQLETQLRTLVGVDVYYNHTTKKDVVNLPFIIYLDTGSDNKDADNEVVGEVMNYSILLHSATRDETTEGLVKTLLTNNHIPYEISSITWEQDLLMWVVQFDIQI